ncbi:MAG: FixH family protein [Bacteroidetes bacterium]|nr:FixH family protein [Bacteroidota bacterium]
MNWGKKIILVFIVFISGITWMVVKSSIQKTDLVTTNYYEKELKYQDKIDEMNRVQTLSAPVQVDIKNNELTIVFPKDFAGKLIDGQALLYCPSDANKDFKKDFSIQDEPLKIVLPKNTRGLHELQLSWKLGNIAYYFEHKIII